MGLENVPNVQFRTFVSRAKGTEPANPSQSTYDAKFIQLKYEPSGRDLIFAESGDVPFEKVSMDFRAVLKGYDVPEQDFTKFTVRGGGRIIVDERSIKVSGRSMNYGSYDKRVVESLLSGILPGRTLEFESN